MVLAFADLRGTIPNIVYSLKNHKITGYSDALSATCKTTATAYLNNIVEHFQPRTLHYLKADYIKKISDDYCWEYLIEDSPIWSDSFDLVDIADTRVRVVGICIALKEKLVLIHTVLNLASSPSWANAEKKMPNMFALTPQSSLRWRHVTINNKSLQSFIGVKAGSNYEGNVKQFSTVFDFRKLKYKSVEELLDADNKFGLFCCNIQTDGHGICFSFGRKKVKQPLNTDILVLEDFDKEEGEK
ncbi:hypothetical protein INT47_000458 [Mucor saturninus]|uniref:Uncharacterized protein n=1 Tax=Mucor saturninus TaxID=64648 RepID=A0A8H7UTS0_9FUNG|nr:hypothetical protein INT47_000458 [Mucor saturninus]